jgi:hypothetical protein
MEGRNAISAISESPETIGRVLVAGSKRTNSASSKVSRSHLAVVPWAKLSDWPERRCQRGDSHDRSCHFYGARWGANAHSVLDGYAGFRAVLRIPEQCARSVRLVRDPGQLQQQPLLGRHHQRHRQCRQSDHGLHGLGDDGFNYRNAFAPTDAEGSGTCVIRSSAFRRPSHVGPTPATRTTKGRRDTGFELPLCRRREGLTRDRERTLCHRRTALMFPSIFSLDVTSQ